MKRSILKEQAYYQEVYDKVTVELCRDREEILRKVYSKAKAKGFPEVDDKSKNPELEAIRVFNMIHYFEVELLAGERWEKRTDTIQEWMNRDAAKDKTLIEARLSTEPSCVQCGKANLRIIDKELCHRGDNYENEEVLFTLECLTCDKRSGLWQDGTPWERMLTSCPKCSQAMSETDKRTKYFITTTYTCSNCSYAFTDKLDLHVKNRDETSDKYWEEDKARFVLSDEKGREYLEARRNLEELAKLGREFKERQDNKEIYEAISKIRKVNIGQLGDVLKDSIEKAGYTELMFEKPDISKDVYVGFSCLDGKANRSERDSRKQLKVTVETSLAETNWRLMSDGISYRLGYLSGRVRAYEQEEDLIKIVDRQKLNKVKPRQSHGKDYIAGKDGTKIIL